MKPRNEPRASFHPFAHQPSRVNTKIHTQNGGVSKIACNTSLMPWKIVEITLKKPDQEAIIQSTALETQPPNGMRKESRTIGIIRHHLPEQ